jgi:PadR family transcriptional regulator PadR
MGRDGLLGAFEELVLLAVGRGRGSGYGMTVRREIEDRTGRDVTIGAVYSTLDRLEAKGLVESRFGAADDDSRSGRARRHFALRPEGVQALARAREVRDGLWEGVDLADLAADAESGR